MEQKKEELQREYQRLDRLFKEQIFLGYNPSKETWWYNIFHGGEGCDFWAIPDRVTCLTCEHYSPVEKGGQK